MVLLEDRARQEPYVIFLSPSVPSPIPMLSKYLLSEIDRVFVEVKKLEGILNS